MPIDRPVAMWIDKAVFGVIEYWPANKVAATLCNRFRTFKLKDKQLRECWVDCRHIALNGLELRYPGEKINIMA